MLEKRGIVPLDKHIDFSENAISIQIVGNMVFRRIGSAVFCTLINYNLQDKWQKRLKDKQPYKHTKIM